MNRNKKLKLAKGAILFICLACGLIGFLMVCETAINGHLMTDYTPYLAGLLLFYQGVLTQFGAFNAIDKKTMVNQETKEDEKT